jgi:hypothetical protein
MKNINKVTDVLEIVVGFATLVTSIMFSYKFFVYNGHHVFWSMVMAISYMTFLSLLFQAAVAIWIKANRLKLEKRKYVEKRSKRIITKLVIKNRSISILIFISWLFLVSYSIISTVGGQYEKLTKIENKRPKKKGSTEELKIIQDKIKILTEQKETYQIEKTTIENRLNSVEDVEKSYTYRNTSRKNEGRLDELRLKIENKDIEIMDEKDKLLKVRLELNSVSSGDVYNYFERIIKIPAFIIQFFLSFFPSLVLDFFSPISFAMFIFRKREKS